MPNADIIDLTAVQPGQIPARCWDSLARIKGWSVFIRPEGVDDGDETA